MLEYLHTAMGLILLLMPFGLIFFFQKKRLKVFLHIFLGVVSFHILLALISQVLGVFTYGVILSINISFVIVCFYPFLKDKRPLNFKIPVNWFLLGALCIVLYQISLPHYNYSGQVTTINSSTENVKNEKYLHPYFSDEWIAVSLINYSIESKSLPDVNPLWENTPFKNPLIIYFSFMAEIFLLLSIAPLVSIHYIAFASVLLLSVFLYILLRLHNVGKTSSVLPILFLPYITNSSNLPGLWYAMPFMVSLVFFVLSLICLRVEKNKSYMWASIISLIVYPPILIFIIPTFIGNYFSKNAPNKEEIKKVMRVILLMIVGTLLVVGGVLSLKHSLLDILNLIKEHVLYRNLDGGTPTFNMLDIVPKVPLLVSFGAFAILRRERNFLLGMPALTGLILWLLNSLSVYQFIIDYPRVVVITSIFLVGISGFGFNVIFKKIESTYPIIHKNIKYVNGVILLCFFLLISGYTYDTSWKNLSLHVVDEQKKIEFSPAAPVNRYLTPGDLRLFSNLKHKKFIAPAWKGLVIGVATNNYPLYSKSSTITNYFISYDTFMSYTCEQKKNFAQKESLNYVYSDPFSCESFRYIASSQEGFVLYEYR